MIICQRLFHIWRSIGHGTDENRVKMKFTQDLVTRTQKIYYNFLFKKWNLCASYLLLCGSNQVLCVRQPLPQESDRRNYLMDIEIETVTQFSGMWVSCYLVKLKSERKK